MSTRLRAIYVGPGSVYGGGAARASLEARCKKLNGGAFPKRGSKPEAQRLVEMFKTLNSLGDPGALFLFREPRKVLPERSRWIQLARYYGIARKTKKPSLAQILREEREDRVIRRDNPPRPRIRFVRPVEPPRAFQWGQNGARVIENRIPDVVQMPPPPNRNWLAPDGDQPRAVGGNAIDPRGPVPQDAIPDPEFGDLNRPMPGMGARAPEQVRWDNIAFEAPRLDFDAPLRRRIEWEAQRRQEEQVRRDDGRVFFNPERD